MVECLRQQLQDRYADLAFDFHEVGISEWEDRVARKVIVPVTLSGHMIRHGVHGDLKHMSVPCYVSVSGEFMTPFLVFSQVNDSAIETLKTEGFRMGVNLILARRQKPYMTAALFQQYITTVLTPFINRGWTNDQLAGKRVDLVPFSGRALPYPA
jgi:hypothetical protein